MEQEVGIALGLRSWLLDSAEEERMQRAMGQAREQLERFSMGVVWVRAKDIEVEGTRNGEKGFSVDEE